MATLTIDAIEGLAERAARIAAYRALLREQASHSLAWFNLAVDELDGGDRLTARRAALAAIAIDDKLRGRLPERLREQVEFAGLRLVREVHTSATQLLYQAVRVDGGAVYLRSLRDRPHALALTAYAAHQALPATTVELVVAQGTVAVPGAETFQILEHQPGHPVGQLLRGDGPARGFAVAEVPRIDGEVAAALALEILEQMDGSKLDLDPDPDLWLRTRRGVISLGPPGWSSSVEWMAPEERNPDADQKRVEVYRAALLVWVALSGQPPPPLDASDRRALNLDALPERYQAIGPTLTAAVASQASGRPTMATLIDRLRAVATSSVSGTQSRPTVPGYKIVRPLGEGGFGAVYEGLAPDGTRVAIKILHPHLAVSADARARFFAEANVAASIDHPGVVRALASGSRDGTHFVVMELVEGESLDRALARAPLSDRDTATLGREVAAAVGAMHTATPAVIHRDLKPANIMLAPREARPGEAAWTARVCDFGVAKLMGDATNDGLPFTRSGQWNGTPPYMAPEQWRQDPTDERTDVYALGCVLYESLVGHPPFTGKPYELLEAHLHRPAPPLPPTVPPRLAAAIARMLAKNPADRFASMAEVEAALADPALLRPESTPVEPPTTPVEPPTTPVEPPPTPVEPPTTPSDPPTTPSDPPTTPKAPPTHRRSRWPLAVAAIAVLAAGGGLALAIKGCDRSNSGGGGGGRDRDIALDIDAGIDADLGTRLTLRDDLRADLTVLGWSADSARFAVALRYRPDADTPARWGAIAEYDAYTETVLRWWDASESGLTAEGEPGWGPPTPGPWPQADYQRPQLVDRARLSVDFCGPPSSRKGPTSIEPGDGFRVRWDRVASLPAVDCPRTEDRGLVVLRDRTVPWSRLLRYAYQASRLPGTGQVTPVVSPDGRRIAIAIVDKSDDGRAVAARVYTRVLGPQIMLITDDPRARRAAQARLDRLGIATLVRTARPAARQLRVATPDSDVLAQRIGVALRIAGRGAGPAGDDDLKWLDVVIELPSP